MRRFTLSLVGIGLLVAGCSAEAPATTPEPVTGPSEASLEAAATELNTAMAARDAEAAWTTYSQRCKDIFGSPEVFEMMLEANYQDRNPDIREVTVKVNGSSGQVVTVDEDPAATADSMKPRTWTFIDGAWQYDSC
ncbi:hypothetical protein [Rhodococcus pyridinivorans]|uniref:hypothetical protein n=1 Tax=Rhodococcus pyridinivorans TaxID=103816 RepID=UPI00110EE943|nr:hypothetical protein [Rhodococcus pyridinivorans]